MKRPYPRYKHGKVLEGPNKKEMENPKKAFKTHGKIMSVLTGLTRKSFKKRK